MQHNGTKKKLLVITPRLLEISSNAYDRRFYVMLKTLAQDYVVHYLFTQSMFAKEDAINDIKAAGVDVISLKSLKEKAPGTIEKQFATFLSAEGYAVVLLNTYFTAKYYMPLLRTHMPESTIVIDASKSQYLSELGLAEKAADAPTRMKLLARAEIDKMKEIAVYSYADAVIVDNEDKKKEITGELPGCAVYPIPGLEKDGANESAIAQACGAVFSSVGKQKAQPQEITDVVLITGSTPPYHDASGSLRLVSDTPAADAAVSLIPLRGTAAMHSVEQYNEGLKAIKSTYGFIMPADATVPATALQAMVHCARSNPLNGIVVGASNISLRQPARVEDLAGFYPKHYAGNFGYWSMVKKSDERALLIKKELVDKVGLLDTRYALLNFALFDFCLKVYQSGYRVMLVNEAFVYYTSQIEYDKSCVEKDKKLLFDKWCDEGVEFLEEL